MARRKEQLWYVYELDEHIICIPDPDTKPHGHPLPNGNYEISDKTAKTCPCNPEVSFIENNNEDTYTIYGKATVFHNSFYQSEQLQRHLQKIGL